MISTLAINGITIGGVYSGLNYVITKLNGFSFPSLDVQIRNKGHYVGAVLDEYSYGARGLSIEGEILGSSTSNYETVRKAFIEAFAINDGLQTLTITTREGTVMYSDVIISSAVEIPHSKGELVWGSFRLELVAPFPYFEGAEQTEEIEPIIGGGFTLPFALPLSLAVGGTNATIVTNDGNGVNYPVIQVYGIISSFGIQNSTCTQDLSVNYTLTTSSDYIEIDMYNRTALYNGVTNVLQYVSGDWITLNPGDNLLKLFSASSSSPAKMVVTYKDSWLGI
jgi:hypothetical protein